MTYQAIAQQAAGAILAVLSSEGQAKYAHDPWRTRSDAEDADHAMAHIIALAAGDNSEPHLHHALTRLTLILARQRLNTGEDNQS